MKGQFGVSAMLTEFCASVKPSGIIGTSIFPVVKMAEYAGTFPSFTRRDAARIEQTYRAYNGYAGYRDVETILKTYTCYPGHAWKESVSDLERATASKALQTQMAKAQSVQNTLLLSQEARIANKVMTAANHINTLTLTAGGTSDGYQFDKYTAGKGSLFAIIQKLQDLAFNPDPANCIPCMAMSKDVFNILKNHPDVIARMASGTRDMPSIAAKQILAEMFEVAELHVGGAEQDTTAKRATATYSNLWTWNLLFYYKAKNPIENAASFGYTFMYNPESLSDDVKPGSIDSLGIKDGWRVRTYRDEAKGGGSTVIEVEQYPAEEFVMVDAGALIVNAIGSKTPV